jgi:hypothetical protein
MNQAVPLKRIAVGVVVERRKSTSHWVDFVWQPVGVLPGTPDAAQPTVIARLTMRDRRRLRSIAPKPRNIAITLPQECRPCGSPAADRIGSCV